MKNVLQAITLALATLCFGAAHAVELSSASVTKTDSGFALQLDLPVTTGIEYTSKTLVADPVTHASPRFFVDIYPITLSKKFIPPTFSGDNRIKQIRWAQHEKNKVRIVFDLVTPMIDPFLVEKNFKGVMISTSPTQSDSNETVATQTEQKEVIVQQAPEPEPVVEKTPAPQPEVVKPAITKTENPKTITKTTVTPTNVRKIRIILDPGHGGDDSGARGKRGTMEKDVTLDVARKVREILLKDDKYDVFMTRENDTTLQLLDRTKFANKMNGDLFVSIHANASPKRTSKGVSTYFLNNADDQESLRVAMRENGELDPTVLKQASKNTDDYYLEVMKASMVKNFHTTQSTDLARAVQQDLLKTLRRDYSDVADLGVRSARFYVLTGATMPAILVETSFISNPVEEKRLSDSRYQQTLAKAVVSGVEAFFKNRPAFEEGHNVFLSEQTTTKKTSRRN